MMIEPRSLSTRSPLTWILAFVCVAFLALGFRTLLFPASAAAFYGVPLAGSDGLAFVQAYGARNIAISLLAITLLIMDARLAIAALLGLAAMIAAFDFWIVSSHAGFNPAIKHLAYIVALGGLAVTVVWTRRSASSQK